MTRVEEGKGAAPADASTERPIEQSAETAGSESADRHRWHHREERVYHLGSLSIKQSDLIKFAGLIVFIVIAVAACFAIWPMIHKIFEPGGVDILIEDVRSMGVLGVLVLFAVQILQVVVAFIPGEVVQMAAGMMYGPWLGALIVIVGCALSSALVYYIVHKLGAPLVQAMVPEKYLRKFRHFEESGKLSIIVFILFLIPGLPKDVFTYIVPLTDMKLKPFLAITTIARIPGIIVSTYAADGLLGGRLVESIVIFAVFAIVAIVGILNKDRIINLFTKGKERLHHHHDDDADATASASTDRRA